MTDAEISLGIIAGCGFPPPVDHYLQWMVSKSWSSYNTTSAQCKLMKVLLGESPKQNRSLKVGTESKRKRFQEDVTDFRVRGSNGDLATLDFIRDQNLVPVPPGGSLAAEVTKLYEAHRLPWEPAKPKLTSIFGCPREQLLTMFPDFRDEVLQGPRLGLTKKGASLLEVSKGKRINAIHRAVQECDDFSREGVHKFFFENSRDRDEKQIEGAFWNDFVPFVLDQVTKPVETQLASLEDAYMTVVLNKLGQIQTKYSPVQKLFEE